MHLKNNKKKQMQERDATRERASERKNTQRNGQGEEEQPRGVETLSVATTLLGTWDLLLLLMYQVPAYLMYRLEGSRSFHVLED